MLDVQRFRLAQTLKNHWFKLKMILGITAANISKNKKSGSQFTNMGERASES